MGDPLAWLASNGAQTDVIEGLRPFASDWRTLWDGCPRGDWLLGIAARLGVDHRALARAAIGCARTALEHAEGEEAARVLEVAERWADGAASAEEVAAATTALEAALARARDPAADAAGRAALAVGLGVSDRDTLASAAAAAAEATILSTMDCGLAMALRWAHDKSAGAVRAAIAWEEVAQRTQAL